MFNRIVSEPSKPSVVTRAAIKVPIVVPGRVLPILVVEYALDPFRFTVDHFAEFTVDLDIVLGGVTHGE